MRASRSSKPRTRTRSEPAFVLHVISADRTEFHQIEFNQSHDRDATVLANGRILFTRWDNAPGKDGMHLYTSNPDGTDEQLYYGANSHMTGTTADGQNNAVIEFVKPREMQDGRILTLVRPYTNVDFGGDLRDHQRQPVRREHSAAAGGRRPARPGPDSCDDKQRHRRPRTFTRRPFQLRLSAVGQLEPHPRELVAVPVARYRWSHDRSLHGLAPGGPERQDRAAAL